MGPRTERSAAAPHRSAVGSTSLRARLAASLLVARLVNCKEVPTKDFMKHKKHHCVTDMKDVPYKRIFAWVVERAERFKKPFVYKHRTGAVIWVKVGRED